jgi:hypothetical protein
MKQSAGSDFRKLIEHFREGLYGFIGIAVGNAVLDAMVHVADQDDLTDLVYGTLHRVDLDEDILARYILVYHTVEGGDLTGDPVQTFMQVFGVHTLFHGEYIHFHYYDFIVRSSQINPIAKRKRNRGLAP